MTTKVSIIGIAKSGTSALYSSVKTALPAPRRLSFEPSNAAELAYVTAGKGNALTKLMFGALDGRGYDPTLFTHRIAIVRDPRDTIVSSILFRFNRLSLINDFELFSHLVALFEQKETDPLSISVQNILEAASSGGAQAMKNKFREQLSEYSDYLDRSDQHVITFDKMVLGDFNKLNEYLGLKLAPPPPLEGWVSKISRKGTSGDWKDWFTPADVAFFREAMDPFIAKYGFVSDWALNDAPVIEPEHCSLYIRRLSEARRTDPNLKHDSGSDLASLLSAAEDGKANALKKLVHIYESEGPYADTIAARRLVDKLGEMGYPKFMIKSARAHIADKNFAQGYALLEKAVARNFAPAFFVLGNQYLRPRNSDKREEGLLLLERGRDLGDKGCRKKLQKLAADGQV